MTEIALAYSSIDKARAEAIARVLGALGYVVSPQPLTSSHVDAARALVVFWSSGSVNSIPINQFAAQASADKKLVSVRAGAADPPAAYALVALHDLSRWTGALEAPELRTFLQHVMRMAPLQQQQQRTPVAVGASNANPFPFAGPMPAAPPPRAEPPQPPVLRAVPAGAPPVLEGQRRKVALQEERAPVQAAAERAAARSAERAPVSRPEPRRSADRRRNPGGGVARIAMGAIAVSVVAGAAVAAFHYDSGQQRTASAAPAPGGANIAVAPNVLAPAATGPTPGAVTDAAPESASAGVQVASAEPLPGALTSPPPAATVQSARGWTATLPTMPGAAKATPVSATTTAPAAPRVSRTIKLTPIDAAPAGVGIVAVDNANLGQGDAANRLQDNAGRPRTAEEERAWIRKQTTYGPDN